MVALRVGQFNRRVTIENHVVTTEDDGQQVRVWTTYCERWAERMQEQAAEQVREGVQTAPQRTAAWRLRRDTVTAAITERMRLKFGERYYGIESVQDEDEQRAVVLLKTTERVGGDQ